jgi:hypothetical protein
MNKDENGRIDFNELVKLRKKLIEYTKPVFFFA